MLRQWVRSFAETVRGDREPTDDLGRPPRLFVPDEVCRETARGLRSHAPPGTDHEGVVYWAGVADETLAAKLVLAVIVPEATTTPGSYDVSPVANAAVVEAVHEHDLELVATVHSHPGARTGHSQRDDEESQLPHEGYYSVVVPNYARDGVQPFTDCGVHVYRGGEFVELARDTVEACVQPVPSPPTFIDTRP